MVSATKYLPANEFGHAEPETATTALQHRGLASLTRETRAEVERLTHALFPTRESEDRRAVLLGEIGLGPNASTWVAIGIGAALAARGRSVHVLCLGEPREEPAARELFALGRKPGNLVLERMDRGSVPDNLPDSLERRLSEILSAGDTLLLHADNLLDYPELLSQADQLDGAALIIRASKTRRAAIEAVRNQLQAAEIPLLGAILLDRTFPIPEKLYRLL